MPQRRLQFLHRARDLLVFDFNIEVEHHADARVSQDSRGDLLPGLKPGASQAAHVPTSDFVCA